MIKSKNNCIKKTEIIILFITGFIVCSSWGTYLLGLLGIRFFLFELFFIPYFLYKKPPLMKLLRKKYKYDSIFFSLIIILFAGVLFGTIRTNGDFISVLSATRPLFYMIIIARIFSGLECVNIEKVYIFSIASIIGELIFINTVYANLDLNRMWYYINSITLALIIIIPAIQKKVLKIIISISIGLIVSVISGYRINIIIIGVSILVGFIWVLFSMQKKVTIKEVFLKFNVLGLLTLISILVIKRFYLILDYLASAFNLNPVSVYRITQRLSLFVSSDITASQDSIRIEAYKRIGSESFNSIIPTGLLGKSYGETGVYTDVPISFLYDAFGSVVTYMLIIIIGYIGMNAFFRSFKRTENKIDVVCGLMFPIIFILLIVNGTFLAFVNVSIITGIIFARWIRIYLKAFRKSY